MPEKCKDEKSEELDGAEVRKQVMEGLELAYGASAANFCRPLWLMEDGSRAGMIIHSRLQDPESKVQELFEPYEEAERRVHYLIHRLNTLRKKPPIKRSSEEAQEIERLRSELRVAGPGRDKLGRNVLDAALTEFGKAKRRRHFNLAYIL